MEKLAKQLADGITAVELVGVYSEEYRAGFDRAKDAIVNGGLVDDVVLDLYGRAVRECAEAMRERDEARRVFAEATESVDGRGLYAAERCLYTAVASMAGKVNLVASLFEIDDVAVMEAAVGFIDGDEE